MDTSKFKARLDALNLLYRDYNEFDANQKQLIQETLEKNKSIIDISIDECKLPEARVFSVKRIKKYDVLFLAVGASIPHYFIVYKVIGDKVYGINITSKERAFSDKFIITKNRAFIGSYFCSIINVCYLEEAKKSFVFTYTEGRKELNNVMSKIKELYSDIFK